MEPDLFQQLGMDHLPDEAKQQMTEQLGEKILTGIERRSRPLLNRKQRKAYDKMAQTDPGRALGLLDEYLPNFSSIEQEERARAERELINLHAGIMKRLGAS